VLTKEHDMALFEILQVTHSYNMYPDFIYCGQVRIMNKKHIYASLNFNCNYLYFYKNIRVYNSASQLGNAAPRGHWSNHLLDGGCRYAHLHVAIASILYNEDKNILKRNNERF
jgi:hypothetical protein